jgi:hypothetical protein
MNECERVEVLAEDLALGWLTGRDRGMVLAHLEHCRTCRNEITELTEAADQVLLLAPRIAPDPGFADHVLDRLALAAGDEIPKARSRRLRPALAAAAAVVALLLMSLLWSAQQSPAAVAATMIDGQGQPVGQVSLTADHGTEVQMDLPRWSQVFGQYAGAHGTAYWLQVTLDDGSLVRTRLPLGDDGTWRVTTPADRSRIVTVAIADLAGHRWCHADFS